MRYKATHRHADMSASKVRPFAALIRNRPADEALELLKYLPNKSARLLEQVLKSALGNAEDRGARDIEDLVVLESRVDGGPIMKRIMPRPAAPPTRSSGATPTSMWCCGTARKKSRRPKRRSDRRTLKK